MNMSSELSIDQLAQILYINIPNNDQIKKNEELFTKYKTYPKFAPLLLEICCDINKKYSFEIELNSAIQLKNFINSNWKFTYNESYNKNLIFDDETIIIISNEDKSYIRNNIIDSVIYIIKIENGKILKQLNQCIKAILKYDFQNLWHEYYMNKIINCFNSNNEKEIYAGIILFHQLSKLFEFEDSEKQDLYNNYFGQINNNLLSFIIQCNDLNHPIQVQFIYKILKIFFKSFQGDITPLFLKDENYEQWSNIILTIIKNPISNENLNNSKNIFWKLRRICFQIITRIYQKYSYIQNKSLETFNKFLLEKYVPQYFQVIKTIYENIESNKNYIDDYCLTCIYNFFSNMIQRKNSEDKVIQLFINNDKLKEQIIKDAMITLEDLDSWVNDPKNYIIKQTNDIGSFFTKRHFSYKILNSLMSYKSNKKKSPPDFYMNYLTFLSEVLKKNQQCQIEENNNIISKYNIINNQSFITNPNNIKHNLIKESILYLIESNEDLIMKYSKNIFEDLVENYILPELQSPIELMREKSMKFILEFKNYKYKNEKLINSITTQIINLLQNDNYLQVKIYSALVTSYLISQENTRTLLKGNIKLLLPIYLKLMEETDLEDIIESLQNIIKEFKDEAKEYIVQLSDYLIIYFNKLISREVDEDDELDHSSLINNIISTFIDIMHFFVNNNEIYPKLENNIIIILEYCFKKEIYDKLEDGIDLLEEIVKNSNLIPIKIWDYFIPLITSVIGTDEELENFKIEYPNQIYEGNGFDSINSIAKIIKLYISKDPNSFINKSDNKGKKYIDYVMRLIQSILIICEGKNNYTKTKCAFDLLCILFEVFKGKIDNILNEILNFILTKYTHKNGLFKSNLRILLSSCFIYNPYLSLKYYESNNKIEEIFKFWFEGLEKLSKKKEIKYNLIGLCSLISLDKNFQNNLILNNMKELFEKIIFLAKKSNEISLTKNEEENDEFEEEEDEEIKDKNNNNYHNLINENTTDDDEDLSWDEDESDNEEITQFDKQNDVLFLRDTLNNISQKSPDDYNKINSLLGDNVHILKEIFKKEEEYLNNKRK